VAIWSTTWIAITFQLGTVAPEISVFYRFFLASALLFAWCALRRLPLRFGWREHAWLALFGVASFGVGYVFVYRAEQFVVSGVVAVGYSASPLLALLGTRAFFGQPMQRTVGAASLLGIAGIALVFYPELALLDSGTEGARGAMFTALAVLTSSAGGLVAHRNQRARLPLWQTMAWSMLYGSLVSLAIGLASGKALEFLATPAYVASLLYLSVFGSIVAFAGYLTLLRNIGPARAGYIGVMVPVAALFISAAFEGFRFHALTWAGIALSLAGNVLILRAPLSSGHGPATR
jgi:drug/metabolite transporter (DMT)-like permease